MVTQAGKKKITFELTLKQYDEVNREASGLGVSVGVFSKIVVLEKLKQRGTASDVRQALGEMMATMQAMMETADGPERPKKLG